MQPQYAFRRPRREFPEMTPARRYLVVAGLAVSALLFLGGFVLAGYLWNLSRRFPEAPFRQPSRLYASAPVLTPGEVFSPAEMVAELKDAGYREAPAGAPVSPGTYRRLGDRVVANLRHFPTPDGEAGGAAVGAAFRGNRVAGVWVDGRPAKSAALEPPLLASFYDKELEERRPVTLDRLPDEVVKAVLAAEDSGFYTHGGVSPTGVARALLVDLRGGEVQGGSTITQQLVKNVYLSNRRTLRRKAEEALIAMVVEMRYGKQAILEAYLNEIYLGRGGPANLIGLGAAARSYFNRDAAELTLAQAATLAGMIQSPGGNSPLEHPDRALERRNWVLQRMGELGWVSPERVKQAQSEPLGVDPHPVETRPIAPYFANEAAAEARDRFDAAELGGKGYLLFSTLRWTDQRRAEAAVAQGLGGLDNGKGKHRLQAALVSVDPGDGAVLAWVGGRDYEKSQFDRVTQARRQVGSAFKPVIYAAALTEGVINPASLLNDSPIQVRIGNASWQPQNYDRAFRGWVTARTALEQSLNIPTVRVALQVGIPRVIELAHELGLNEKLQPRPSLALGAFEASPFEMAQVYATLAAGGLRPPLHTLAAVIDPKGERINGDDLPAPKRALPVESAYLVTSMLQGVIDHGTAAAARGLGVDGPLAGKTGTTNDRRDNWFAGYSPDRASVVWVGYDDNSPTSLSGARAALPIWSRFTAAVRPARGYPGFPRPAGVVQATIDPTTGQLATEYCPYRVTELFPSWAAPVEPCQRHSPNGPEQTADLTLNQPAIDPETGQPVDPSSSEEPRYSITDDGLQIKDPGGDEPITISPASPARTFPPHPITVPTAGAPTDPGDDGGSILIRPTARPQPEHPAKPAPPQDLALTGPVGMVQGNGVVPPGSQAIGKKAEPKPAEAEDQQPAADQSGDQDTSTETSPPP
ncbi:MAG TPA: PBP1A family penicillin-binding protein [Thermoanaerobaculia bacterium]|nr:PBP1A family penicillin-binding protein [Thermoanaerobaculia bacterium]